MKRIVRLCLITVLCFCLYGCGNTDELDAYYNGMSTFNGNVQIITETLEMIDVESDSAVSQVCNQLDKLVEQFKILSELKAPSNFSGCDELADDAYAYMQEATRLYKDWADGGQSNTDDDLVSMAKQNYERAMKRVNYISIILQGGIPEGEGVTITEEDATDFAPVIQEDIEVVE